MRNYWKYIVQQARGGVTESPLTSIGAIPAVFILLREVGNWGDADPATMVNVADVWLAITVLWGAIFSAQQKVEKKPC